MKALIVSDTHGLSHELTELKERYADHVDAMIHCGDSELYPDRMEMDGFFPVEGNCDAPGAYPNERIVRIGALNILIAHGHLFGVRQSPTRLCDCGLERNADIICFGHTHVAGAFQQEHMIVINPGSLRLPRNYHEGTYVILDYNQQKKSACVNYYNAAGEPVDIFSKSFNLTD
ncbi:metallophosphoesterase [Sporolactobacillus sp. CPB3-1]|uniref:Phosphoesterase n=1 Tax=Sporolactobacillus mangiferae TaxID=2940498 RepID=A0ABT0M6R0_9BACL|nr:metallophosphoesterase [Sporolactobacillus mangiferae]MCL1630554.1 metallophosphoesterase [Sporolactobacillus mangiferae]